MIRDPVRHSVYDTHQCLHILLTLPAQLFALNIKNLRRAWRGYDTLLNL